MFEHLPSYKEILNRQEKVRAILAERGLSGAVFFHPLRIQYLCNFSHLSTERPIAFVLPVKGEPVMLVPKLEDENVHLQCPWLKQVCVYFEYPGLRHPLALLVDFLKDLGFNLNQMGADLDGYLDQNGYQGPTFSELCGAPVKLVGDITTTLRLTKSEEEIRLLHLCGEWAAHTHRFLQAEVHVGDDEISISRRAEERTRELLAKQIVPQQLPVPVTITASIHSGTRTTISHASMNERKVERGDTLVTYCQGIASNYYTELERTMYLGEPGAERRRFFEIVREAQKIALDLFHPGTPCKKIDEVVARFLADKNCTQYTTHHQGHGLGLEFHEAPFLDVGDPTVLQVGMVMSVEPGIYVPGLGGFRHSDTVLVTPTGPKNLTPYPSEIEELIISA